jgi:hypothetical protein
MVFSNAVDFYELSSDWNVIMRMNPKGGVNDLRTDTSKFIHVQFPAADHKNEKFHWDIVNLPLNEWGDEWVKYSA